MTDRVKRMFEHQQTTTYPLCIDKMLYGFPVLEEKKGKQGGGSCPHCGCKLVPSQVGEYRWTCRKCDEDFYDFECKD